MYDDDAIEELKAAWQQLDAPQPCRELEEEDELTRRSVEWMQQAWQQLEAPPLAMPVRLHRSHRVLSWPRLAAAAGILLAVGWAMLSAPRPQVFFDPTEQHNVAEVSPQQSTMEVVPELPMEQPAAPVVLANREPGRIEMKSGPVRLVLLQPDQE